MKEKNTLGIVSLVLGIIALVFSVFFVLALPLAIASIVVGIVSLVKREKKVMAVVGIVLSSISFVIGIGIIVLICFVVSSVDNNADFQNEIESGLVEFYNEVSKGITDELNIENKLDGYKWEASDGSVLELKSDGTYYWYKDSNDKTDNYYTGTYVTYVGDKAVDKIDSIFGFNEEAYTNNNSILRTDIYYLELNKITTVIGNKEASTIKSTPYALFFYNTSSNECEGMNLNTQNTIGFTKVN